MSEAFEAKPLRLADHAMQLLDNGRQINLASGGCGTYLAASLRPTRCQCGCGEVVGLKVEAEAEGATPSEAVYALVRQALNRAARRHRKRKGREA